MNMRNEGSSSELVRRDKRHVLSILVPSYNEQATLERCIDRVRAIENDTLGLEIIIIDDCSENRSREIAQQLAAKFDNVHVLLHSVNQGKGAAIHTGIKAATGDFVAIQDADLEYNPQDLLRLVVPLIEDEAEVAIGSRFFLARHPSSALFLAHHGQSVPNVLVEHVYRPEPNRHGNVLQSLSP